MEVKKNNTKKEIVKKLLNKDLKTDDENELFEMLIDEPLAIDVDKYEDEFITFKDKLADKITEIAGSWNFIITFIAFLLLWMLFNGLTNNSIDPYPFILLNLVLSCIAALQAPIIMMSQNREAKKDSLRSKNDYRTDLKSELILEVLHDQMNEIAKNQKKILKILENQGYFDEDNKLK